MVNSPLHIRQRGLALRATVVLGAALSALSLLAMPASAAGPKPIETLKSLPCPRYEQTHESSYTEREQRRALNGRFDIEGKEAVLIPPVNWDMDPYNSRAWRARLHNWLWIDALFFIYTRHDTGSAVTQARDLGLDWIKSNPMGRKLNWGDKISGDRAGYLSYLARAAACEGKLSDEKASRFLDSIKEHGDFLYRNSNYSSTNHGLFMDLGLMLVAQYVPFLSEAEEWRQRAVNRFKESLRRSVNFSEGVHLEHSPGYHLVVRNLVQNAIDFTDGSDGELRDLLAKMEDQAGWFTMPDKSIVQFGDTGFKEAPDYAVESAQAKVGLSEMRRSGYSIVKEPGSWFGTTAGFHSGAHKQADELSFDLFDDGQHVLTDTGRFGLSRDKTDASKTAARNFTLSSQAHSSLVIDGRSFDVSGSGYGSGIEAQGRGSGWYAIQAVNPLAGRQGVSHRRVFLYRPDEALVVVDALRSGERHKYSRHFQFDTGIDVTGSGRTLGLDAGNFSGAISDARTPNDTNRKLARGQENPLLGWYDPGGWTGFQPRYTAVFSSEARDAEHAAAFALDGAQPLEAEVVGTGSNATTVRLSGGGRPGSEVSVVRNEGRLTVAEAPAP